MSTPTVDKLTDLFFNCSVAVYVTDGPGKILLENKAARAMTGREGAGQTLHNLVTVSESQDDLLRALDRAGMVENIPCGVRHGDEPEAPVWSNVSSAQGSGGARYLFWMLRPDLTDTLPAEGSEVPAAMTDAGKWISSVNAQSIADDFHATDQQLQEMLELFFHNAPAGIHLLAADGSVAYANRLDINLVGHEGDPEAFLGHHVRQIYQDHRVVEDFMGRWGEDAPIINFRANFVRADRGVQPVLIYSTANAEGGLQNTRCIVFRDPRPDLPRSSVSAFDFEI